MTDRELIASLAEAPPRASAVAIAGARWYPTVAYVALLDGTGRISAQYVRRRRRIAPA